jgi:hypothetical protein
VSNNVINPNIVSALKDLEFNKSESSSISDHYTNITDTNIEKIMMEYEKIDVNAPITNDITNDIITKKIIENEVKNIWIQTCKKGNAVRLSTLYSIYKNPFFTSEEMILLVCKFGHLYILNWMCKMNENLNIDSCKLTNIETFASRGQAQPAQIQVQQKQGNQIKNIKQIQILKNR